MTHHRPRRHHRLKSEMNVIPYIDVMLVLLIIFMMTAPIISTGINVDLPQVASNAIASEQDTPILVSINPQGQLFVSHQNGMDSPMTQQELLGLLHQHKQQNPNATPQVFIRADTNSPYGQVMQVLSGIEQSGIAKVGLLSQTPDKAH